MSTLHNANCQPALGWDWIRTRALKQQSSAQQISCTKNKDNFFPGAGSDRRDGPRQSSHHQPHLPGRGLRVPGVDQTRGPSAQYSYFYYTLLETLTK
jgi:hypothetical protein